MILDLIVELQMPLLGAIDDFSTTTATATSSTQSSPAQEQPGCIGAASWNAATDCVGVLHRVSRDRGRDPLRSPLEHAQAPPQPRLYANNLLQLPDAFSLVV